MMMFKYFEAIEDARMAIQCDELFKKAHVRLVNCFLLTGNFVSGFDAIAHFKEAYPDSSELLKQSKDFEDLKACDALIAEFYNGKDYKRALEYLNRGLKIATACEVYKDLIAKCEGYFVNLGLSKHHRILCVPADASLAELKAAYKKQAFLHHPDKHAGSSETLKKYHEEKFKHIKEAYDFLVGGRK